MRLRIVISKEREVFHTAEKIRYQVFVDEQGFSSEIEVDDVDSHAFHVVAFDGEKPVGAARYFGDCDPYHIGRVAVIPEYRGKGVGSYIMRKIEGFAKENGAKELTLGSQLRVEKFYASLGYERVGEEFLDEGCPHIEMRKALYE